jgi:hypothetical protein
MTLYQVDGSKITEIGKAGDISPFKNPHVERELYTIEIQNKLLHFPFVVICVITSHLSS